MPRIKRPLKAPNATLEDFQLNQLTYPVIGSPKIDGFRCLIDEIPKTSSMKPQPNQFILSELSKPQFNGLDGELVVGSPNNPNTFNRSTGPLRRKYGKPDFTFWVFDNFLDLRKSYIKRWIWSFYDDNSLFLKSRIKILTQIFLFSSSAIINFTDQCVASGYEGAMIRSPKGLYKQGRATFKEMNIFKRKPLTDTEAVILGFIEQQTNENEAFLDEMGLTKRKTHASGKVGAETLGSFILYSPYWKKPFKCGGGKLTHKKRQEIWNNQAYYLGKTVIFKYQQYGSISAPRQPIFKRFFDEL
jgi:DNA ligase-1